MTDYVEEIKGRLSIVDVVSQYVQLKKAGTNYKGLCPFHGEKSPSFVVSPEKQICHCFGCHKGGDIFTFIEEIEGVNFSEAMEILADKAGIKIEKKELKKAPDKSIKDEYYKANKLAAEFFQKKLYESNDGKKVLEYLKKRGVNDEIIKEFQIGFAPESYDSLHTFLLSKGISKDVLLKSGLVSAKGIGDEGIYDKYRSRLIFPIFDYLGKICGFGGRALRKDQMPKYLNSPENLIYNKSKVLYGLHLAKQSIKAKNQVVIVEGYFDTILPYQVGVDNVVATSGTALTQEHVKVLKRISDQAILCFDTDNAGVEATKRAFDLLKEQGFTVKVVTGLDKKDPADFIREHGEEFIKVIEDSTDFITYMTDRLIAHNDPKTIDGMRAVIFGLLPFLKKLTPTEKDYFVRGVALKLGLNEAHLYAEIDNFNLPKEHPARSEVKTAIEKIGIRQCLLGILIEYPNLFDLEFSETIFTEENTREKAIYKALTDQYNQVRGGLTTWNFDVDELAEHRQIMQIWALFARERYDGFSEGNLKEEVKKMFDKIQKERRARKLNEIHVQIVKAEESNDMEKLKVLLQEQQSLLSEN